MTYNIHPIFVHFPIAFLLLYSVIKLIPLSKWFPRVAWKDIRMILLIAGILGGFVATSTGEIAEHLTSGNHDLVEAHGAFAVASLWLYGLLLLGEISSFIVSFLTTKIAIPKLTSVARLTLSIVEHKFVVVILVLGGLVTLSIAGLLGGVIVYGTTADPLAPFVLQFLGL